jgi:hypothetical protein
MVRELVNLIYIYISIVIQMFYIIKKKIASRDRDIPYREINFYKNFTDFLNANLTHYISVNN